MPRLHHRLSLSTSLSGYTLSLWSLATLGRNFGFGRQFCQRGKYERTKGQGRQKLVTVAKNCKVGKRESAGWVSDGWEEAEKTDSRQELWNSVETEAHPKDEQLCLISALD